MNKAIYLLLGCLLATLPLHAQDSLRSVDIGTDLKAFVTAVKQANATDAASAAKQRAAEQVVTSLLARITATNATPEEKFSAHGEALSVSTDAALARLSAVRRTAALLDGAREALAGARRSLGLGTSAQATTALPSSADTRATDASLADFTFADGEVDRQLAESMKAAKDFHESVAQDITGGTNVKVALDKADQTLRSFQARTRRELVRTEAALGRLEIQAAQGLASVATHTLAANTLDFSLGSQPFLPLPQVGAPTTAATPFASEKVSVKSAFGR